MAASLRIGRIFGIPIYLHITFLIIVPLFIYLFSAPPNPVTVLGVPLSFTTLSAALWVKYFFGTLATILFFITILAHEIAHSYLAQKYGVDIKSITLMIFGGVSQMEEVPRKNGQEWRMAAAGPMTSLVIGIGTYLAWFGLKNIANPPVWLDGTVILLGLMGIYNLLLAGFNLIPAFPMDGGRILRSLFAERMPFLEATRRAARIGRYFAVGMALFGIFFNFFFIVIALFVYIAATEEEQATAISESLQGVTVGKLMSTNVEVVHPDTTIEQLHDLMLSTKHMGFPVVDKGLVGIVTLTDTHKIPRDRSAHVKVADIMTREVVTAPPDMDAAKALHIMTEKRISRLVVLQGRDIVGIVTQKDFLRAVNVLAVQKKTARWGQQFDQPPLTPPI
jgi:Zn-dependent protease/CBS domain-containing protein